MAMNIFVVMNIAMKTICGVGGSSGKLAID